MAVFQYKARGKHGDAIVGTMDAASTDVVATQLIENELTPITIVPVQEAKIPAFNINELFSTKVKATDLIQFSRQMHSLMKAGVPILSALAGLAQSTANITLQKTIRAISESLQSGRDLATALAEHPQVFSVFYISMIRVGETSGKLDAIFLQLALYLERDKKTKEQIKSAIRYPSFVMGAIVVAVGIINFMVMPAFANMFSRYGADLPWATKVLLTSSEIMVNHWLLILGAAIGGIIWIRYYLASENGRFVWDKQKLKIPIIGSLIHRATMVRFTRLFSMSIGAGVPLITTLTVVARALDNVYIEERILGMQSGIERGESISRTAMASGMFDALVLQMMSVGEETGSLEELLDEVANYYEQEVTYQIDKLSASIEPILTIVIGIIVLILALGVFLPMWGLGNVAFHKN